MSSRVERNKRLLALSEERTATYHAWLDTSSFDDEHDRTALERYEQANNAYLIATQQALPSLLSDSDERDRLEKRLEQVEKALRMAVSIIEDSTRDEWDDVTTFTGSTMTCNIEELRAVLAGGTE